MKISQKDKANRGRFLDVNFNLHKLLYFAGLYQDTSE